MNSSTVSTRKIGIEKRRWVDTRKMVGGHTETEWQHKFYQCDARCYYCKVSLTLETATKEHKTPVCRGGTNNIDNIVPACQSCNQMKAWRTEEEFLAALPRLSTKRRESRVTTPSRRTAMSLEERANEPGLLKKVKSERDGKSSWAWRNPA
jgi:5-methylcytosine-specific restriction endonuclease McrA